MAAITHTIHAVVTISTPTSMLQANALDGLDNAMGAIKTNRTSFWFWQAHCFLMLVLGVACFYMDGWDRLYSVVAIAMSAFAAFQVFVHLGRWRAWTGRAVKWLTNLERL